MKHLIIPDTQVKPGVPISHLTALGNYIVEKKPDVIIHLGDHWDMASLSSYDRGKKSFEGRRYKEDVEAGNEAMASLLAPLNHYNSVRRKTKSAQYKPRMVFCLGNHEDRIMRAVEENAVLENTIGYFDLDLKGWEVVDYLDMIEIDGVYYSHYFYNPNTGKPYGGTALRKLHNLGFSYTMGHQQGKDLASRHLANGATHRGLVVGSFYQHEEKYKGPQGNHHWRGCVIKHGVKDGDYALEELPIDFLMENWL